MPDAKPIVNGLPDGLTEAQHASTMIRIHNLFQELKKISKDPIKLSINEDHTAASVKKPEVTDDHELSVETRALRYQTRTPNWHYGQLVLPDEVHRQLNTAIKMMGLRAKVFDTWGLKRVEPYPRACLNFFGPAGTGKTMAAHAMAAAMGIKILEASYAEIDSMYHGEGPKNIQALFHAAQRDNALLFIDEADSLLSKRITNVTQGSEIAANSIRSQLLLCLEQHQGVVVFATNLVENYDKAFETRVRHVHFPMPDYSSRCDIWALHMPEELPVDLDVDVHELAKYEGMCGRDIKNIVVQAALSAAMSGASAVSLSHFEEAIEEVLQSKQNLRARTEGEPLSQEHQEVIANQMTGDEPPIHEDQNDDDEEWVCDDDER